MQVHPTKRIPDDFLFAGTYLYACPPGEDEDPVRVRIDWEDGIPVARVLEGEDRGLELDARNMPGRFTRVRS